MPFQHGLTPGDVVTNAELARIFKCATQGGMRRSHRTDALVLVSDHTQFVHQDRWITHNLFHYTGMGLRGDQSIDYLQNKTLSQSATNGVSLYLFEVYEPRSYLYRGQVTLFDRPFEESQPDLDGRPRTVWVFPLQVVDADADFRVPLDLVTKVRRRRKRQARQLSDEDLYTMAVHSRRNPSVRHAVPTVWDSNVYVAELTRRRAKGICQLCDRPAPFHDKKDEAYLEPHHIVWRSQGGADTVDNSVALCPNCHKKMHILNLKDDRRKLVHEAQKSCCQLTIDGGVVYV